VNDVPVVGLPEGTWLGVRGDRAVVGGVGAARIFEPGAPPRRAAPGADVSGLLRAVPRYDARR
jgi:dipeptidase E